MENVSIMVYTKESEGSGGYVLAIIVNGQPLSERADGSVIVPFETEYQIRLRNKTSRRALAKVYIDDECVTPTGIIVNNFNYVDLDRPTTKRTKFKFVAVDSFDAVDAGKNRENDPAMGVIRVEFYPEKERAVPTYLVPLARMSPSNVRSRNPQVKGFTSGDVYACGQGAAESVTQSSIEAGATVEGSYSSQNFTKVYFEADWSQKTTLRVVLKGYWPDEHEQVYSPVSRYVKDVVTHNVRYCPQCGARRKRPSAKFCDMCSFKF